MELTELSVSVGSHSVMLNLNFPNFNRMLKARSEVMAVMVVMKKVTEKLEQKDFSQDILVTLYMISTERIFPARETGEEDKIGREDMLDMMIDIKSRNSMLHNNNANNNIAINSNHNSNIKANNNNNNNM